MKLNAQMEQKFEAAAESLGVTKEAMQAYADIIASEMGGLDKYNEHLEDQV
jgi:hypothetical protein